MIPAFVFICIIKCCILKNSSINVCNILVVLTLYILSFASEAAFLFYERYHPATASSVKETELGL